MGQRQIPGSARDPLWFKDAVIYALHVKTFSDGNGDGVGDFIGLTSRLDYLAELGVSCIWLLPFYVSPLGDDGYDIADYLRIDPRYGTLDDFDRFLTEAHARGLQVITELVINHTSDQHPWFKAARAAAPGSPARDFYVWSDTDRKYAGARIIFRDLEASNWTWDPIAGAYYWHRFFHHQPDLNFDNPHVREAVLDVMRFWLERGVDGLRLDAIPHLFERDGTNCENLPETHAFLKEMRADLDARFANRVLLAEANLPPATLREYFADGDECHMAFNFPLTPRLFLGLKQGDVGPIAETLRQTQDIPAGCQWATFLRNHDELSVSALATNERADMYRAFASDPHAQLNRGIRRRLAPLLGNDQDAIVLAHALLLSLPGSPVVYYGDEIGMGDNTALADRDGLRTPMQWSAALHGGFSANVTVITPVNEDEAYGYRAVNVEAQRRDSFSLYARIRHLIQIRRRCEVFGRGSVELIDAGTPSVLAFVRRDAGDAVLVLANLAHEAREVSLTLPADLAGGALVDLVTGMGGELLDTPATFSLPGSICQWLQVVPTATAEARPVHGTPAGVR